MEVFNMGKMLTEPRRSPVWNTGYLSEVLIGSDTEKGRRHSGEAYLVGIISTFYDTRFSRSWVYEAPQ